MANDVYQLIIVGNCAGEFFETVQHYESGVSGGIDPAGSALHLIDGFQANVETSLQGVLAEDVNITGYKAKRVNNGGGPTVLRPIVAVPGTIVSTSATSGTAAVIVSRYSQGGRWRTGRWFLPGIPESVLTGNQFSAGYITDVAALIAANQTFTETGSTFTFGVWARKTSTFFAPTYVALSPKPGIQRRRLLPVM